MMKLEGAFHIFPVMTKQIHTHTYADDDSTPQLK